MKNFIEIKAERSLTSGLFRREKRKITHLINIGHIQKVIEMEWGTRIVFQDNVFDCELPYREVLARIEAAQ